MYTDLKLASTAIVLLIQRLFGDLSVAVADVVSSLTCWNLIA